MMDKAKIREKLATECMGWELGKRTRRQRFPKKYYSCLHKKALNMKDPENWHPDTDWNQMMGCVEKIGKNIEIRIDFIGNSWLVWYFNKAGKIGSYGTSLPQTTKPLLAIAEAIGRAQGWWEEPK